MERLNVVQAALHVERHADRELRFFASPAFRRTRRPDLAWHSCDDLWRLLDMKDDERTALLRSLRRDWPEPTTVATADGPVVVQPHFMGEGIVEAFREAGFDPAGTAGRLMGTLRRGCTAATKAQVPHLSGAGYLVFHLEALGAQDEDGDRR
jgi:hypothetical protein